MSKSRVVTGHGRFVQRIANFFAQMKNRRFMMLDGTNYPGKYIKYLNYEIESGISLAY